MQTKKLIDIPKYLKISPEKSHGVVLTPEWIVNLMLDRIDYVNNLEEKLIIDPACGTGNFLVVILDRLLNYLEKKNFSYLEKIKIIQNNIFGIELDPNMIKDCEHNLDSILLTHNIKDKIKFNLYNRDALDIEANKDLLQKFDFVIGNPPYIRIQNLETKMRKYIQENYTFCKSGSTDIYIAFFQIGINLLKDNGILSFITPNTYFYSNTGKEFRTYLKRNKLIKEIINFNDKQLFKGRTTYSAITILDKANKLDYFKYYVYNDKLEYIESIPFSKLIDERWVLDKIEIINRILEIENRGEKLGKIAEIHVGIATLADDFYIFKNPLFEGDYAIIKLKNGNEYKIEKSILKPIVKVSILKSGNEDQNRFIIFPYKLLYGKYVIIEEREMIERYPLTYNYFLSIKERLLMRDKGKKISPWYAFGRTQGLNTSFGEKILISPIGYKPKFIVWKKPEYTFYAGYCIKYNGDLDELAKQLNSEDMEFYIKHTSRLYKGGYRSFSKSFISNFGVILKKKEYKQQKLS
ncbi:MAG: N-6 DNA methylase [Candidatus Nanopusillus acidilobi]